MSLGLILTIAAGFIWSLVNVIDKAVVSKFIRNPIFMILIFSMISLIIGLIIILFLPSGLAGWAWVLICVASVTYSLGTLFYFYALKIEEASRVVPLFALSTVFLVILSAIFLGELFSFKIYSGIFIIIIGSFIITARNSLLDSFKSRALWLMIISSLGFAVTYVINKYLLFSYTYWQIFGIQRVLIGVVGFFFILLFFDEIKQTYRQVRKRFIALSGFAELLNVFAVLLFTIAITYWYVTLVEAVVSVQYVFIFFLAIIISRFKPNLFAEEVGSRVLLQKVVSIVLIVVGIILIV